MNQLKGGIIYYDMNCNCTEIVLEKNSEEGPSHNTITYYYNISDKINSQRFASGLPSSTLGIGTGIQILLAVKYSYFICRSCTYSACELSLLIQVTNMQWQWKK